MKIKGKVIKGITNEIVEQRNLAYPQFLTSKPDEFDNLSETFIFTCDGELMVAGRICSSYYGPIFKECNGIGFRNSKDTVDLERYFVTAKYRGIKNLYEFFVLSSFKYIMKKEGIRFGQSALRPGRQLQDRLVKLHFDINFIEVPMHYSSGLVQNCYPVLIDFEKNKENIIADLSSMRKSFEQQFAFVEEY